MEECKSFMVGGKKGRTSDVDWLVGLGKGNLGRLTRSKFLCDGLGQHIRLSLIISKWGKIEAESYWSSPDYLGLIAEGVIPWFLGCREWIRYLFKYGFDIVHLFMQSLNFIFPICNISHSHSFKLPLNFLLHFSSLYIS